MEKKLSQEEIRETFLASAEMYENFVQRNVIWKDMKLVVEGWKQECLRALSDPNDVNTLESLADMQGRIYMCDMFLNFPDDAINVIKAEEEVKNGKGS